jgi:hypothetical protein
MKGMRNLLMLGSILSSMEHFGGMGYMKDEYDYPDRKFSSDIEPKKKLPLT